MCYESSCEYALIHRVDDEYIDYDDYDDFEENVAASNNAAVDPYAGACA